MMVWHQNQAAPYWIIVLNTLVFKVFLYCQFCRMLEAEQRTKNAVQLKSPSSGAKINQPNLAKE